MKRIFRVKRKISQQVDYHWFSYGLGMQYDGLLARSTTRVGNSGYLIVRNAGGGGKEMQKSKGNIAVLTKCCRYRLHVSL